MVCGQGFVHPLATWRPTLGAITTRTGGCFLGAKRDGWMKLTTHRHQHPTLWTRGSLSQPTPYVFKAWKLIKYGNYFWRLRSAGEFRSVVWSKFDDVSEKPPTFTFYPENRSSDYTKGTTCQWRAHEFCSGGCNKFSWGQRERGSGDGSPLVRGSGGSCNLVQEI